MSKSTNKWPRMSKALREAIAHKVVDAWRNKYVSPAHEAMLEAGDACWRSFELKGVDDLGKGMTDFFVSYNRITLNLPRSGREYIHLTRERVLPFDIDACTNHFMSLTRSDAAKESYAAYKKAERALGKQEREAQKVEIRVNDTLATYASVARLIKDMPEWEAFIPVPVSKPSRETVLAGLAHKYRFYIELRERVLKLARRGIRIPIEETAYHE